MLSFTEPDAASVDGAHAVPPVRSRHLQNPGETAADIPIAKTA
jgi:hypothetical protein